MFNINLEISENLGISLKYDSKIQFLNFSNKTVAHNPSCCMKR